MSESMRSIIDFSTSSKKGNLVICEIKTETNQASRRVGVTPKFN